MAVIAHHLILTGYGHWLPNDPRGSLSHELKKPGLGEAGAMHLGRKRVQPSREELKAFRRRIDPLLQWPIIWFDDAKRQAAGEACGQVITTRGYTCYAAAVMNNHVHLLIRRHRDKAEAMIDALWEMLGDAIRALPDVPEDHPVWSRDPYKQFKSTPEQVWSCIDYINGNPRQAGKPPQHWPFVQPYNNWPFHNCRKR